MSKIGINTGTSPDSGSGDSLLLGAVKINSNFNEIYSTLGDGTDLSIGVGKTVLSTLLNGNIGIGSTIPTSKLTVNGNSIFTGVVTATTFNGQVNAGVGTIRTLNSNIGIVTNLTVTNSSYNGIATFTNGPILVGSGTSTGTVLQKLQVNGGVYISNNLGLGNTDPSYKLHVIDGDIAVGIDTSHGLILSSPNGTKYRIHVLNDGSLKTIAI